MARLASGMAMRRTAATAARTRASTGSAGSRDAAQLRDGATLSFISDEHTTESATVKRSADQHRPEQQVYVAPRRGESNGNREWGFELRCCTWCLWCEWCICQRLTSNTCQLYRTCCIESRAARDSESTCAGTLQADDLLEKSFLGLIGSWLIQVIHRCPILAVHSQV